MSGIEIALLIIGAAIVIVSFLFFGKDNEVNKEAPKNDNSTDLTEKQRASIERQIVDIFDEKMDSLLAKQEAQMDMVSVKTKQEMDEYSGTIMSEINRNHNEVMFLYDMLNEKKKEVNNAVRDANAASRMAMDATASVSTMTGSNMNNTEDAEMAEMAAVESIVKSSATTDVVSEKKTRKETTSTRKTESTASSSASKGAASSKRTTKSSAQTAAERVKQSLQKDAQGSPAPDLETGNNNKRILELNKLGKSNVEIAKELGIGIGEVKLVIDLFKGGR